VPVRFRPRIGETLKFYALERQPIFGRNMRASLKRDPEQ
jgi:hypothetical protein